MCCKGFYQRLVPFAITFALGILAASIVYSFLPTTSVRSTSFEKSSKHKRTDCGFGGMRKHHELEDVTFIEVPPPAPIAPVPPPPPAPLTAPDIESEVTVFPPTPPETIILKEDLRSKK